MRTLINSLSCALLVAASPLGVGLLAQGMSIPTARLQSLVDSVRINAFYQLRAAADDQRHHPDRRPTTFLADSAKAQPELAAALIHLLERENARIATASAGSLSEDYLGVYYMDLTTTVGRIGDPTSAAALLGGMGGSGPADAALASFGDIAVPGLIAQFHSTDLEQHASAVGTLVESLNHRAQNHLRCVGCAHQRALARRSPASSREFAIVGPLREHRRCGR